MLKRNDFIKIICLRSTWENSTEEYKNNLLDRESIEEYISSLVYSQMKIDNLGIASNGNLYLMQGVITQGYTIYKHYGEIEKIDYKELYKRIELLTKEVIAERIKSEARTYQEQEQEQQKLFL